jgi:hypothetical protein
MLPGFVTPYKGHIHALHALKLLPENFKLIFAGGVHPKNKHSADYWISLLSAIDKLKLSSRVVITGFIDSPADQAELFSSADIFLLPYKEVGQSGSAVLADVMAYRKPIITSNAASMSVYRMTSDTCFSSIITQVTSKNHLAETIMNSYTSQLKCRKANRDQDQVIDMYGPQKTLEKYRSAFSLACLNIAKQASFFSRDH